MFSKIIKFTYLILFFLTPLIFTSFNSELFELPKMYLVYGLTLIILVFHLLNWSIYRFPLFRKTFLTIPFILFLVTQTISTIISVDPHTSVFGYYSRLNGGLLSLVCYLILFWVLSIYIDDKFKNNIISVVLLTGFLVAGFGVAQHFGIDKNVWVQDVQNRIFSTLGQPNWLAAYLCILLPFSFYKLFSSSSLIHKSYFIFLTSTFYLSLLFTKSKSGIIAAIISLAVYFIIIFFKNIQFRKLLIINFSLIIALSLLINNPIKDLLFPKKVTEISNVRSDILITPSEDIRKIVWTGSIDLWKKFPLFGTGVETFAYSYYWTRPAEHNLTSEWDFLYNKAHNEYLNYLATTGAFGFLAYMLIIFSVLFFTLKNIRSSKDSLSPVILASYISILITNFAGFSTVITSLFFFLLPIFFLKPIQFKINSVQKKIPFSVFIVFLSVYLFSKIIFYYLADITYAQSESYDSKNDYLSAFETINLSLSYRPNEPLYLDKYSLLASKLAVTSKSEELVEKAISASNKAINISPANTNFWKERSQMYYYLSAVDSKYFQESINSLLKVTLLAPTDAKSYFLLGQFLETVDLKKDAVPYYEKAINLKSNYDHAYFQLGKIYLEQKNYSESKKYFESTIKIAPNNIDAKTYLDEISKQKI